MLKRKRASDSVMFSVASELLESFRLRNSFVPLIILFLSSTHVSASEEHEYEVVANAASLISSTSATISSTSAPTIESVVNISTAEPFSAPNSKSTIVLSESTSKEALSNGSSSTEAPAANSVATSSNTEAGSSTHTEVTSVSPNTNSSPTAPTLPTVSSTLYVTPFPEPSSTTKINGGSSTSLSPLPKETAEPPSWTWVLIGLMIVSSAVLTSLFFVRRHCARKRKEERRYLLSEGFFFGETNSQTNDSL